METLFPSYNISMSARYVFSQERRDWAWWESLRNYIYMNGNSWYVVEDLIRRNLFPILYLSPCQG